MKGRLAYVIVENFRCYSFFRTNRTLVIIFMGRDEDVTACTIVLEYAIDYTSRVVKKLRYEYSTKGLENDYALGFIEVLNKDFKKQKEANQEWGLVLVRDQAVINEYNNKKFKDIINTNIKFQGFGDAYYQRIEDGENFSTSDRIAGEEEKQLQDGTRELFNTDYE